VKYLLSFIGDIEFHIDESILFVLNFYDAKIEFLDLVSELLDFMTILILIGAACKSFFGHCQEQGFE